MIILYKPMKTSTSLLLGFFLLLFFFGFSSYPQVRLNSESIETSRYDLNLTLEMVPYSISSINGMKKIHFTNYMDESQPGSLILPSKDIFIAIPRNSTPDINITVTKLNTIFANPEINPIVFSLDDSTVIYKPSEPKMNFQTIPVYEFKGYLWINNNYCIHLKVNQYRYDYNNASVSEIREIKIELVFDEILKLQIEGNYETRDDLIINPNFAFQYQSKPKYLISNADGWIDYTKTYIKIGTAANAIYHIYYNDFIELGIDVSQINPKTFSLVNRGNSVPIYVDGEEDGSFGSDDYIEF